MAKPLVNSINPCIWTWASLLCAALFADSNFRKNYDSTKKKLNRAFLLGVLLTISIGLSSHYFYKHAFQQMVEFRRNQYTKLEKSYFSECILGIGIIYHTNICVYDGWRPPKHDPLLVFNLWLTRFKNPTRGLPLKKRLALYRKFYPNNSYKFNCSCANEGSWNYHNDKLWQ